MRILIYGIGGVGGYFGAKMAKAGYEVTMIARGGHLAAIRENGLEVESINGDFRVFPKLATTRPTNTGQYTGTSPQMSIPSASMARPARIIIL